MKNDEEATKRTTEKYIKDIMESKKIHPKNKEGFESFYNYLQAKDLRPNSLKLNAYNLNKALTALGKIPYDKATQNDINRTVAKIYNLMSSVTKEPTPLSDKNKSEIITSLKQFYRYLLGKGEFYPDVIRQIKAKKVTRNIMPEDILKEDDIVKMLDVCQNLRDRALIAALYDTGARVGELLEVRLKDISLKTNPARITLASISGGKTGTRNIPIVWCVPYLQDYIKERERKGRKLTADDIIWRSEGFYTKLNKPLDSDAVRLMLARVAKRAKVAKAVNPHAFRHARASYYANHMTEQQMKLFFGWTANSNMASVYVHLSTADLDNEVLRASGVPEEEIKKIESNGETILKPRACVNCKHMNTAEASFCSICGTSLTVVEVVKKQKLEERLDKVEQALKMSLMLSKLGVKPDKIPKTIATHEKWKSDTRNTESPKDIHDTQLSGKELKRLESSGEKLSRLEEAQVLRIMQKVLKERKK